MHPFAEFVNPYLGKLLASIKMDKKFVRGEGCYLFDDSGNRYLDCIAAYGALPFGYNPKAIWDVINDFQRSMEPSFVQPSALEAAGILAELLIKIAPADLRYVTFTNSGAEAAEAAVKLCRSATGRHGILSTIKGFHGKTLGALSATGNSSYQTVFGAPVEGFAHIPFGDADALEKELKNKKDFYAAFFVEPIQGEGGIVEPPKGYLKNVREICSKYGVRLVADEIQTGLGRTGKMFACADENVSPDVLLLAKALGGGIIPIGACLSNENTYNEDFAMKHSSTFAGNSLACRIGLKVLELLLANNEKIMSDVIENGNILKLRLKVLKEQYPDIIKSVRGRGFMLGIEFKADKSVFPGSLLGIMGEQELFTPAVSSYLLNVEKLRVAPTLNGNDVIRIEPPLVMSRQQCNDVADKIGNVLNILKKGSSSRFLSYLIDSKRNINFSEIKRKTVSQSHNGISYDHGKFAFLVHPLNLKNYCEFDESLYDLDEIELAQLTDKFSDLTRPFVISGTDIVSKCGSKAYGEFIAIPRTAEQLSELPREQALSELKYALDLAKDRGARIVGLGAYTSVVSMGGLHLKDEGIALTTGNSYTVISAVDAINMAAESINLDLGDATVAVVGASGSIGKGVAVMMAEKVSKLILIGNSKNSKIAKDRLLITAAEILRHVSTLISDNRVLLPGSLAEKVATFLNLSCNELSCNDYLILARKFCDEYSPILISTSINEDLRKAEVVVCATSSTNNLLTVDNLGRGAVVCDISRPKNIEREVEFRRPDVLALDGGVIKVPGLPYLGWNFGLDEGLAYACMAETMMLALEQHYEHTSIGSSGVTIDSVLFLRDLAAKHGFELTGLRSFDEPLDMRRLETVKAARCDSCLALRY